MCQWAIKLLNVLTGNLDREGGVMFTDPGDRRGRHRARRARPPRRWRSRVRGLPEPAASCPWRRCARRSRRRAGADPGDADGRRQPGALDPDGRRLERALDGLDFMVAVDIYLNETTRHADVILPPTAALERDTTT